METLTKCIIYNEGYEPLKEYYESLRGVNIPGVGSVLVKRDAFRAIYKRSDGYYEVFRIELTDEHEIFGRVYPASEKYPSNEDFGVIAICTSDENKANRYYESITPIKPNKAI
jgi:hypothetical protein